MENINMTHVFKHPKFYRIPRDKSDQAISNPDTREVVDSVRPDPGHKQQASSSKPQAASSEILEPRYMDIGEVLGGKGPRVFAKINVLSGCFTWNAI